MRFKEFKTKEASFFNEEDEIDLVKSSLISLIGNLPKDEKTLNYLKQVQDTLKKQGVGSRVVGFLNAKSVSVREVFLFLQKCFCFFSTLLDISI